MMLFRSVSGACASPPESSRLAGLRRYRALAGRRRLIGVLTVVALVVVPLGMTARADDRSDAVDQQAEAQQRQDELTASLEGVSAELGQAYIDLQNAETALTTAEDDLATAEDTLAEKEREQQLASDRLDVAEADLATVSEEATASEATASESTVSVGDLVVSTYQGDSTVSSWSYVLSSDTVDDLTQRASSMEIAASIQETVLASAEAERARDANRKARQDAATDRVATMKDEADTAATEARTARDEAADRRDEVATLKSEKETAASNLETQKKGLEDQQEQAAADADAAAKRIAEIDAANRAAYESGQDTGVSSESIGADSLGDGYIGHPISGPLSVTSPFGYRVHPVTGVGTGHQGTDFAAADGTPQDDYTPFHDLGPRVARRLLEILPAAQLQDRQNLAPTLGALLRACARAGGRVRLSGYGIGPQRPDERVTVEGLWIADADLLALEISEIHDEYCACLALWETVRTRYELDAESAPDEVRFVYRHWKHGPLGTWLWWD